MDEEEKKNGFNGRILVDLLDVLAVINHLEDNLDGNESLKVILTIEPRRADETDCCSIKERSEKTISIKNQEEILGVGNFLTENLFIANIYVAIE
ncbi:MAG: hypothetical protein A2V72_01525 [Candidatus Nealsonbacteria bacterium RBG_13_37_56]|uniref:Uncharacterized protein n=1 Tax=Candidatus Nealsonbacteria bacterium RBG_13_37_56 TaxID=1801661 RepID=A0A1G2DVE3_9BACT|nr:MAG: hypothetical protein A2V72_01525 [Candidatus Nealsonbacteria bacterium RBG_13_37_56]